MAFRIQLRRGTSTSWTNANTLLAQGEVGLETDTNKIKIGNGETRWNDLPYNINSYSISEMQDVLANSPNDGSVLVYQNNINKWVATTTLDKQVMDGGHF